MTGPDLNRTAEEDAAAALLAEVGRRSVAPGGPPADFVERLFAGAAAEDVVRYPASALADLAAGTWSLMAARPAKTSKIRLSSPTSPGLGDVSVVDIVNDNMPFLLDSILSELNEQRLEIVLVAHPVVAVRRDPAGRLTEFAARPNGNDGTARESVIHIHVRRIDDARSTNALAAALFQVLTEVRRAVDDWREMLARARAVIAELKSNPPPLPVMETVEAVQFLEWLMADNFTLLGMREYALAAGGGYEPNFTTALGILRSPDVQVLRRGTELVPITPEIMEFLKEPKALIITKANVRSRVHRRVHMDYIGLKRFDHDGRLAGELRIVGLFTSTAYTRSARTIPYLRRKVDAVLTRARFDPDSHSGKALANILEHYPRDELFQVDEDTLFGFALAIMHLDERPRVRVLPRLDRFDRFVSILVYVPRERFDSDIRAKIGDFLANAYNGRVAAFYPYFPEGPMVRVHFIIARYDGATPRPERDDLEREIAAIVRSWTDELESALEAVHDRHAAQTLLERYGAALSGAYRVNYRPASAVADIRVIEGLSQDRPLGVNFYRRPEDEIGCAHLKLWSHGRPIPLSERVPVLEHMGFRVVDESTFHVRPSGEHAAEFWLHDMTLERIGGGPIDLDALKARLDTCFLMVMTALAEDDGYNALVLAAGLAWRDVALVRTLSRYLRQIRVPYSQDYMWATLARHAAIAAKIVDLFHARFEPGRAPADPERATRQAALVAEIEDMLARVDSLDEDRIVRHFVNVAQAAIRTTYYQLDRAGQPKPVIAIKFDSRKVDGMPLPRPLYEVFLCSPRLEAVHLRFGKVARGGIRWSDRPQDFRTEILGLVKAQQVKNAVIVPVGAKGGFVPKRMPAGNREAIQAEGVATYREFMSTLLDITDNLDQSGVVPPGEVVRHDPDDPYLVVAADKGTATFSDIANGIAQEHGFWLDDAFASGGSAGYDHKRMGITARGAWESVKRHFREMDVDIARTPFTVAGVGDMSGDVFGNGMLRDRTIRLVAAFDHRDIFLDPDPDPKQSLAERQRLFDLPRSSWQDYDERLISKGGGVFSRAAKEIDLSPQAQAVLGFARAKATPQEVMNAILKAPVDLLWFGGIGTYVRAASESNDAAGDRANDAIRAIGGELRCKVVGEGANLGITQRGRIEAAFAGIRLNTDAIDNSAGVNTSDVEVNLKIALSRPMRDGRLARTDRNTLLAEMTDLVARLVLRNNYQQTLALSLAQRRGLEDLGFQQRLMQTLERRDLLDRAVEFLPDDMELAERRRRAQPLTRPELAVLLAYAKLSLNHDLLASTVPDDPYLGRELGRYFPAVMSERFADAVENHRLRREIIATQLANSMINRGGPTLVVRIADQTGASADRIAAAFAAVRDSYAMVPLNTEIESLDGRIPGDAQLGLFGLVQNLLLDRLVWFLRNVDLSQGLAGIVEHYRAGIAAVAGALDGILLEGAQAERKGRVTALAGQGVPDTVAARLADLPYLTVATDAVLVADRTGHAVADVAATYLAAGAFFQLDRIATAARAIPVSDYFDRLALDRALDSIGDAERRLTAEMMRDGASGRAAVDAWVARRGADAERVRMAVHEIAGSGLTLSKLTVAASMLGDLARA